MPNPNKAKHWVFTLNNYDDAEERRLQELPSTVVEYIVYGREKGDSGTPHLQGYVVLRRRTTLQQLRTLISRRAHFELARGTPLQAAEYCKKDGDVFEAGVLPGGQGSRTDLLAVKARIDFGASDAEIAQEFFSYWVRYHRSFSAYRDMSAPRVARPVRVHVLTGAPGTGKTRLVFEKSVSLWIAPDPTLRWFDGYSGEPDVLIDDYRGGADDAFILRLLDRYPLRVPVKGGFVSWRPLRIFITSNEDVPFGHFRVSDALRRRVHVTRRLDDPLDFETPGVVDDYWNELINES